MINGRFKIVSAGNLPAPGKCVVCGTVERDCLDFGLDIDYFGAVLLCATCMGEAATVMGLTASTQPTPLYPNLDEKAVCDYVRNADDAIRRLLTLLPPASFDHTPESLDDSDFKGDINNEPAGDSADTTVDDGSANKPVVAGVESFKF